MELWENTRQFIRHRLPKTLVSIRSTAILLVLGILTFALTGMSVSRPNFTHGTVDATQVKALHLLHTNPAETAKECDKDVPAFVTALPAAFSALGVPAAWNISRGNGVTVAVVDSGVSNLNPHLTNVVLPGKDFVDADGNGTIDNEGHGTAIAGQIAAQTIAGSGLTGIAPEAKILPVRVFDKTDEESVKHGRGVNSKRTADGIIWAAEQLAQIIVVAQSWSQESHELHEAVRFAEAHGSLVVTSAGNKNTTEDTTDSVRFPAAYPETLSVTAVDMAGNATDAAIHGPHTELAAPGDNVLTTFFGTGDCVLGMEAPASSYSTGYVGAGAALVAQVYPHESPAEWKYRLLVTASRTSIDRSTDDRGWGVISIYDALNFINDGRTIGPDNPKKNNVAPVAMVTMPVPDKVEDPQAQLLKYTSILTCVSLVLILLLILSKGWKQRRYPLDSG